MVIAFFVTEQKHSESTGLPTDESSLKIVYLATQAAARKWTMPIQNWKQAMNRFAIEFEEQLAPYM